MGNIYNTAEAQCQYPYFSAYGGQHQNPLSPPQKKKKAVKKKTQPPCYSLFSGVIYIFMDVPIFPLTTNDFLV